MLEVSKDDFLGEWTMSNLIDPVGRKPESDGTAATEIRAGSWPIRFTRHKVGLLSNRKPNADAMLEEVQRGLGVAIPGLTFVYGSKEPLAQEAPLSVIESLSDCDLVVLASAECGGCTSWVCRDYISLEERGVPCLVLATDRFEKLARTVLASGGITDPHLAIPKHPVSGIPAEQAHAKVRAVMDQITGQVLGTGMSPAAQSQAISEGGAAPTTNGHITKQTQFSSELVSDGLPVFAPTEDRVRPLLDYLHVEGSEIIGIVPPENALLTFELAAANAAMTGCSPAQFWIVTEIMKALLTAEFNLLSIQATTHPAGPCILISGPAAAEVGIQGGSGCMGPGWAANARIGRAVRLILMNVGGARPGGQDMATFGSPAKWSFVFTDQDVPAADENRWPTLAEEVTGSAEQSVVCAIGGEGPLNVNDHFSTTASGLLKMVAHTLATVGSNHAHNPRSTPMVVLGQEHAAVIAAEGFTREDVRQFIARYARIPLAKWSQEARNGRFRNRYPKLYQQADDWDEVAVVAPQDLVLAVAGGPGKHSVVVPAFGRSIAVRPIERPH